MKTEIFNNLIDKLGLKDVRNELSKKIGETKLPRLKKFKMIFFRFSKLLRKVNVGIM